MALIADPIISHRVTPRHGSFRLEAVAASGAVQLVATYRTEGDAMRELRLLQLVADRAEAAVLAIVDGPKGPRGKLLVPVSNASLLAAT